MQSLHGPIDSVKYALQAMCPNMQRLVQLKHSAKGRRVALVEQDKLFLLTGRDSVYQFAEASIAGGKTLAQTVAAARSSEWLDYEPIYQGQSDWWLLPAFDHPSEPARCLVTGTGLTHKASAENRQAMHAGQAQPLTDSMRMYQSGLEGGHPAPGTNRRATGMVLQGLRRRSCGRTANALVVPSFGLDGGEEAEVAGVYIIDRIGPAAPRGHGPGKRVLRPQMGGKELSLAGAFESCAPAPWGQN